MADPCSLQPDCPYLCAREFCDIPNLYGTAATLQTAEQSTTRSMPAPAEGPSAGGIFRRRTISRNRKAAKDMLPHLLAWQKDHGYPLQFRLRGDAQHRQAPRRHWSMMRECCFPRALRRHRAAGGRDAIKAMRKDHKKRVGR